MVKLNFAGIVFGSEKDHWWDGLVPFETFTGSDGSAVDSTKWDTVTDAKVDPGRVDIRGNKCMMYSYANGLDESESTLILKTARTSGRIIFMMSEGYLNCNVQTQYIYFYAGNDTDGWTTIHTIIADGDSDGITDLDFTYSAFEAIYQGDNKWNVYLGNTLKSENLTKANGLQFKITARARSDTGQDTAIGIVAVRVDTVYII